MELKPFTQAPVAGTRVRYSRSILPALGTVVGPFIMDDGTPDPESVHVIWDRTQITTAEWFFNLLKVEGEK